MASSPRLPDALRRDNPKRCDLEGKLHFELHNGYSIPFLDDNEMASLICYYFKATRNEQGVRRIGQVRVTVELLEE
jgi:hypothetical protein